MFVSVFNSAMHLVCTYTAIHGSGERWHMKTLLLDLIAALINPPLVLTPRFSPCVVVEEFFSFSISIFGRFLISFHFFGFLVLFFVTPFSSCFLYLC